MKELAISKTVLWTLSAIGIAILGLFFLVGYDTPWEENPKMKNPDYTDLLLWSNIVLIGLTILITLVSVIVQLFQGSSIAKEKGLAGYTNIIAFAILVISIVAGFVIGKSDTEALVINAKSWNPADEANIMDNVITGISMISIAVLSGITFLVTLISIVAGAIKK
jgi:hypothetical protein